MAEAPKFIVDSNAGKLVRWLRAMGYDTLFFESGDDFEMVTIALRDNRIVLTRDTQIIKRRVVTSGRLKVILFNTEDPEEQMRQVVDTLGLDSDFRPFSLCLECNQPLEPRTKEEVRGRVPSYVFRTHEQYVECPVCHRIYWRGSHWRALTRELAKFKKK